MLPEATYLARPIGASFGTAESGNPQVAVEFEILDGDQTGHRIAYVGVLAAGALEYTIAALRATGWDSNEVSDIYDLAKVGDLKDCEIVVQHDTYKGNTKAKVQFVNRPGGGRFTFRAPLEGDDLKRFSASLKSQISGMGPRTNGAKKPTTTQQSMRASAQSTPDDIPF